MRADFPSVGALLKIEKAKSILRSKELLLNTSLHVAGSRLNKDA